MGVAEAEEEEEAAIITETVATLVVGEVGAAGRTITITTDLSIMEEVRAGTVVVEGEEVMTETLGILVVGAVEEGVTTRTKAGAEAEEGAIRIEGSDEPAVLIPS